MVTSPNEKGTIYIGAQFLFRSRDHGQTWERISPDLTTNDPEKQKQEQSGGVTVDNSAAEMHTTIFSISESPKDKNVIWVGTDDGNVQLTRDGAKTWNNVVGNVPGLPKQLVGKLGAGQQLRCRHGLRRFRSPYLWRLRALSSSTPLTMARPGHRSSLAQDVKGIRGYAHVIKEDLVKPNLLFLGTEFGLFISIDGGKAWAQFKGSRFPAVAVRDLAIQPRDNDLVLGTHGRGIWIIDDITPLRALTPDLLTKEASFRPGGPVQQQRIESNGGWPEGCRGLQWRKPARRGGYHLLPKVATPFRQAQDRDPRSRRQSGG